MSFGGVEGEGGGRGGLARHLTVAWERCCSAEARAIATVLGATEHVDANDYECWRRRRWMKSGGGGGGGD